MSRYKYDSFNKELNPISPPEYDYSFLLQKELKKKIDLETTKALMTLTTIEKSDVATHTYEQNDYLIYNKTLYLVIQHIAVGDTLVSDVNIKPTTVAQELALEKSIQGNFVNFYNKYAQDALSTKITLDPIQDLHGYDKPWVGGAGKNLCSVSETNFTITAANSWRSLAGVEASTATNGTVVHLLAGTYFASIYEYSNISSFQVIDSSNNLIVNNMDGGSFTLTEEQNVYLRIRTVEANVATVCKCQLESGSTATSWTPYTNICPISGRTQVGLKGCGKNLVNYNSWKTVNIKNGTAIWENNGVTLTATANECYTRYSSSDFPTDAKISVTEGQTVTLSWKETSGKDGDVFIFPNGLTKNNVHVNTKEIQEKKLTYTVTSGVTFITFRFSVRFNGDTIAFKDVQLELGSTATTFEPYQSSNDLTISFGQTVYGGTVDIEKGELVVDMAKVNFADLTFNGTSEGGLGWINISGSAANKKPISNKLQYIKSSGGGDWKSQIPCITTLSGYVRVYGNNAFKTGEYSDAYIVYQLATPTVIPLTPAQVHLLKGINNISTDGDDITLIYKEIPFAYESELNDSGHTIKNDSGTSMTQRGNLQFKNMTVIDNSTNNVTVVEPINLNGVLQFSSDGNFTLSVSTPHWDGTIEYSINNGQSWTTWNGSQLSGTSSQVIWLRGSNNTRITGNSSNYKWTFIGKYITGNIETLLDYQTVLNGQHPSMNNFCYQSMFQNCTSLIQAPELPATTLTNGCYNNMFFGCTSLIQAPKLPATTLAFGCYGAMFRECTSLTTAPKKLPATTLAAYCCDSMFYGCTSLIQAPELPATTLDEACYGAMFSECTSLTTAPKLPATTLAAYCYYEMFSGCTSLIQAPELPATTLDEACYQGMFGECTSLTQVPELPATILVDSCYYAMFSGCTSLKLSTTQTGEYQYEYRIPTTGTGTDAEDALLDMFTDTGGTFTGTPTINTTYYTTQPVLPIDDNATILPINPSSATIASYQNGTMWIETE